MALSHTHYESHARSHKSRDFHVVYFVKLVLPEKINAFRETAISCIRAGFLFVMQSKLEEYAIKKKDMKAIHKYIL